MGKSFITQKPKPKSTKWSSFIGRFIYDENNYAECRERVEIFSMKENLREILML